METANYLSLRLLFTHFLLFAATANANAAVKELCNPQDKRALLAIKQSIGNGSYFGSWTPETDCCRFWDGVKCNRTTDRVDRVYVVGDGNYTLYLSGVIPDAVGDLSGLTSLRFHKLYNLSGTVPPSISKLQNLIWADFSWNGLSGPIPTFFYRMKSLRFLDLSYNKFSGSVPPELALGPALFSLDLSRNELTGPIPEEFGSFRTSGIYLILSHNKLSGPVPRSLANVPFAKIDFSRNELTGDAAFLFGKGKQDLETVDLSRNMFAFDMSRVDLPSGLISLDVNHNEIFGSLPAGLADLQQLQGLNVSYNRLCGQIPVDGKMGNFDETSYLHNKCLCGSPLPACK